MMKLARRLALIVLAAAAAVALAGTSARSAPQAAKPKLTSFGTCGQLLGYAKGQAKRFVGPYGYGTVGARCRREALPPVARAATPRGTRPGRRLLRHERAGGRRRRARPRQDGRQHALRRREREAARGRRRRREAAAARLARARAGLEPRAAPARRPAARPLARRLLDRAAARARRPHRPVPAVASRSLAEIDVSDPAKRCGSSARSTLDGSYVAARLVGSAARIVVSAQVPAALPFEQPTDGSPEAIAAAKRTNEAVLARSKVASWLPSYRIKRAGAKAGRARPLVQCRHVRRPTAFSGLGMLTVLTVDLDQGPAARRLGRGDDRRPDRLRVAGEPLRRHRALGRPARPGQADGRSRPARRPRSTSSTSRARRRRSTAAAAGSPATCSASGRSPSTAACSASSAPRARRGGARAARPSRS